VRPAVEVGGARVFLGDCRNVLRTLPDNSVDSIVTDPPYELGFMGKKWDSSGIAYDVTVWAECLRVLKPGGHVLAFGGSRTWHRLAVAVEDAGFELRDSIAWIYGSGFPKSLDVSKAIDKRGGSGALLTKEIGEALRAARESRGISKSKADEIFCDSTTNWTWFEGRPAGQRPPTPETFARIVAQWPELAELSEKVAEAEREVIGQRNVPVGHSFASERFGKTSDTKEVDETLPSTSEAQKWQGWGTALKPAFEPVVVGRKPFGKGVTVAENVLAWGVGGLNIDGSRIAGEVPSVPQPKTGGGIFSGDGGRNGEISSAPNGRWPANVILDEVSAGLLDEQSGFSVSRPIESGGYLGNSLAIGGSRVKAYGSAHDDKGGASRFFYVAKASKRDRNEGLEELEATSAGDMVDRVEGSAGMDSPRAGAGRTSGAKNFHPTVKPTRLMRYLIKLVTPAGGTVLDPFTGSGSTGKAALLDGYGFIGAELTEEYLPIIEGRLRWASEQVEDEDVTLF
jgi:DNA modification methylase